MNNALWRGGVLLCLALLLGHGCMGNRARETVLMDSVISAAAGVEFDVRRGIAAEDVGERTRANSLTDSVFFFEAIRTRDRDLIRRDAIPMLPRIDSWVEIGIIDRVKSGEIGPNVAASLRERASRFNEALMALAGPGQGVKP